MNTSPCKNNANRFGHRYEGLKTEEGYGVCSLCGCRENTDESAARCFPSEGNYKITRENTHDIEGCDDVVEVEHLPDGNAYLYFGPTFNPYFLVEKLPSKTLLEKIYKLAEGNV